MLKKVIVILLIILGISLFNGCLKDKPENYEQEIECVDSTHTCDSVHESCSDSVKLDSLFKK